MNRAKKLCQGFMVALVAVMQCAKGMHCTEALSNPLNMLLQPSARMPKAISS